MSSKNSKTSTLDKLIIDIVKTKNPKTVAQLVELIYQKTPLPKQEIMKQILRLKNQGELDFKKDETFFPSTLRNKFSLSNSFWYWLTIALSLATVATVLIIPENTYPLVYIRHILGSIFILFLPGYVFIKAIFPTKELGNIERTTLSVGMSLVLVSVTGLIFNYTPWGITTIPILLSLLTLTTLLATLAIIRKQHNYPI